MTISKQRSFNKVVLRNHVRLESFRLDRELSIEATPLNPWLEKRLLAFDEPLTG
ncbi:MAG: hypothetical protein ACFB2W_10185 [Leptolyngbyaceae cyanobacterium]